MNKKDVMDLAGLGINEVVQLEQDRIAWRHCVHHVANPRQSMAPDLSTSRHDLRLTCRFKHDVAYDVTSRKLPMSH